MRNICIKKIYYSKYLILILTKCNQYQREKKKKLMRLIFIEGKTLNVKFLNGYVKIYLISFIQF